MEDWSFWKKGLFLYVCLVVEVMYTNKTGNFGNEPLCLC